jgi:hypothetical protein
VSRFDLVDGRDTLGNQECPKNPAKLPSVGILVEVLSGNTVGGAEHPSCSARGAFQKVSRRATGVLEGTVTNNQCSTGLDGAGDGGTVVGLKEGRDGPSLIGGQQRKSLSQTSWGGNRSRGDWLREVANGIGFEVA